MYFVCLYSFLWSTCAHDTHGCKLDNIPCTTCIASLTRSFTSSSKYPWIYFQIASIKSKPSHISQLCQCWLLESQQSSTLPQDGPRHKLFSPPLSVSPQSFQKSNPAANSCATFIAHPFIYIYIYASTALINKTILRSTPCIPALFSLYSVR